jgi:hypothetical protein
VARQSTDSQFRSDPRLDRLAMLCGWSRRETAGCLQLDIWPICYDRVTPMVPAIDLEVAAARGSISPVIHKKGFVGALIESGLARKAKRSDATFIWTKDSGEVLTLEWRDTQWSGRVYIHGAPERIAYLIKQKVSGRVGGENSARIREDRRKRASSDPSEGAQGSGTEHPSAASRSVNPTLTPTVTPPDLDPDLDPPTVPERGRETAPSRSSFVRQLHPDARSIAERIWQRGSKLLVELQAEGIDPRMRPWQPVHSSDDTGWVAILDRVCELLTDETPEEAEARCACRLDVAAAEARSKRTARWFVAASMFSKNSFAIYSQLSPDQMARKPARGADSDLTTRLENQAARVRMLEEQERAAGENP